MMKEDFKLNDIPKRNVYKVPENYFDRLPMRVMEQTAAQEEATVSINSAKWWRLGRIAIAPLMLLLLFVCVYFYNNNREAEQKDTFAIQQIPAQDIVEYLDTYATLEAADFENLSVSHKGLAAEFLNVSPTSAEEELEYYTLDESNL
ncbi:hypothetical protein ACFSKU_19480 [Pontibacter silvestris]|uniref:Uncharacterized protein n=1 Tax=Pontibacter silvestris TaxID=2305183 RepID=A0ABW4X274_9BACT|nr:hypothetical protein [Pontibacter silvestris]MCC9134929.1 hypothetical protein [Pontibacter silvestris]